MKRPFILVLTALLLLSAGGLLLHLSPERRDKRVLKELTEHCDVPFPLTLPAKELPPMEGYTRMEGFGCQAWENEGLSLTLSGYPDVQDPFHVTSWTLLSSRYTLFGLRSGCALKEAEATLTQWHYQPLPEDTGTDWTRPLTYRKGPLRIRLGLSQDLVHVDQFQVSVSVTNKGGVVF